METLSAGGYSPAAINTTTSRLPFFLSGGPTPHFLEIDPTLPWRWRFITGRIGISKTKETLDLTELTAINDLKVTNTYAKHLMVSTGWTLCALGTEGLDSEPWCGTSLLSQAVLMRRSNAWIRSKGRGRWDDLTRGEVDELVEHLYHPKPSRPPNGPRSRDRVLRGLTATFKLRERGSAIDGLAFDPREGDKARVRRVLNRYRITRPEYVDKPPGSTKSIPWDIAQELLQAAFGLVEHPLATTIVAMAAVLHEAKHAGRPRTRSYRLSRVFQAWEMESAEGSVIEAFALSNHGDLGKLFRDLVAACWIVVALFAALRLEEAASLSLGASLESRNDGEWLVGTVRKTSAELVGSIVPLPVPPIVAEAVKLARSATAHHRGKSNLLLIFKSSTNDEMTLSSDFASRLMREFARRRCRTDEARTFPYASHQMRKLYVQLFVRRFEGRVEDAQQHLRHVSRDMIEDYTSDPALIRMIAKEQRALTSEVMLEVMHGTEAAAGRPAILWRAEAARNGARTLTIKQTARLVNRDELVLQVNPIGYCVTGRHAATQAACGAGSDGLPDRAEARDVNCCGCANGLSLGRHLPLLKAAYLVHKQVVDSPHVIGPLRQASETACFMLARRIEALVNGKPAHA